MAQNFVDQSPPVSVLHYLNQLKLTRLHTEKTVILSSKAAKRWFKEYDDFIDRNDRDTHKDTSTWKDIPHHNEYCLVYNPDMGSKPWFTNFGLLIFLDIIFLGWIQRAKFDTQTFKVDYSLTKLVLT